MFSALRPWFQRPAARAAALNFSWLVAERAARLVLNVGVGFWVARYLGPDRFGIFNYGLALVGLVSLLAELGLESVVRRELIQSPTRAAEVLATTAVLRLVGGGIAYAMLVVAVQSGWAPPGERELLAILGLTLFQPAFMVADLWFQARLRSQFSVWAQGLALTVGAGVRLGLIATGASLTAFAWAVVIEAGVAAGLLAVFARREGISLRVAGFDLSVARRLLREAWPLLLSGFAVVLYLRIDVIMLRSRVSDAEVGIYAAAIRFTEIWYFLPVAMASSVLPALLRARTRGPEVYAARLQVWYDANAGLAYLLAGAIALTAPWLVRAAYGPAFAAATPVIVIHIWSSVFVFLGVARGQFLINEGYTRFYFLSTTAGLLVNVVLNLALIPRHGAVGAALATLAATAVAGWLSSFCFAPVRPTAWMQARALLIPFRWYHYVRRT